MAFPAGEAGNALKSTDTMQSTVDRISTPQIQRAAQIAKQGGQTATAPVRYTRAQLSQGLQGSIGLTRDASKRVLSEVRSVGGQYQVAKHLERNDVDGSPLNQLDEGTQPAVGSTVHRGGDDTARAIATDGGGEVWRVHQMDLGVNTEALASNLMRHSDEIDVNRVVNDLETLSRADVDGVGDLAQRMAAGDASNVRGAAFEAKVAVTRGADNIQELGKSNPHARGEIDIETTDGRVIEAKSGDYSTVTTGSNKYDDLSTQLGHYRDYTDVEGGTIEVAFREEPSSDVRHLLDDSQVEWRTYE